MALRLKAPDPTTVVIAIGVLWWLLRKRTQAAPQAPSSPAAVAADPQIRITFPPGYYGEEETQSEWG
jgi:hypothetical protein